MAIHRAGERIADHFEIVQGPVENPHLAGGMGLVYLCADLRGGISVALKTFRPEYFGSEIRDRLLREATTWVQLGHHPHIVRAFGFEQSASGEMFLVLELIPTPMDRSGVSLRTWIEPNAPLSQALALTLCLQIVRGMKHAVIRIPGLVHRDLKPENILVGADGNARITDFGLAATAAAIHGRTTSSVDPASLRRTCMGGGHAGTPLYMAPEQWQSADVDLRADIYSVGCILKEMLTGWPAVYAEDLVSLRAAHQAGFAGRTEGVPDSLRWLLSRCLAVEAAGRFHSWSETEDALLEALRVLTGAEAPAEPASQSDDLASQASSFLGIGHAYGGLGRHDLAISFFERSRALAEQVGDKGLIGETSFALASALEPDKAAPLLEEVLRSFIDQKKFSSAAVAAGNLGAVLRKLGDHHGALTHSEFALTIFRVSGNRVGEARELLLQGNTYKTLKNFEKAKECYAASLKIADDLGNEMLVGMNCFAVCSIFADPSNMEPARTTLRYALLMYVRCGRGDYATDVVNTIDRWGLRQDPQSLALDSFFGTAPTPEAMMKLAMDHPLILTSGLLEQLGEADEKTVGIACVVRAIREKVVSLRHIQVQQGRQAEAAYRHAAEEGNVDAHLRLAAMYFNGRGVPQDDGRAVQWLRKAAQHENAAAEFALGAMYVNGRGVRQDDVQAVQWYRKAAEHGNADAEFSLGGMYFRGEGVPRDEMRAVQWFRKGAEQGHVLAQFNLGALYQSGQGVPQDDTTAAYWFGKAAEGGADDPGENTQAIDWYGEATRNCIGFAQFNLGVMYSTGRGVAQDDARAVQWLRKAADHGDINAQSRLGAIEQSGRSMPQNDAEARKWLKWLQEAVERGKG